MEVMRLGWWRRAFRARQQASTICSWASQTVLLSWLARRYAQTFSTGFSSGA